MPEKCPQCGKEHATFEELQAKEQPAPKKLRIKKKSMTFSEDSE